MTSYSAFMDRLNYNSGDISINENFIEDCIVDGEKLISEKKYLQAELLFTSLLNNHPNVDLAKAYLMYCLIKQHKPGWADIMSGLQVSAYDEKVKSIMDFSIVMIGKKFKNHRDDI